MIEVVVKGCAEDTSVGQIDETDRHLSLELKKKKLVGSADMMASNDEYRTLQLDKAIESVSAEGLLQLRRWHREELDHRERSHALMPQLQLCSRLLP
jgi:hypothetical protein